MEEQKIVFNEQLSDQLEYLRRNNWDENKKWAEDDDVRLLQANQARANQGSIPVVGILENDTLRKQRRRLEQIRSVLQRVQYIPESTNVSCPVEVTGKEFFANDLIRLIRKNPNQDGAVLAQCGLYRPKSSVDDSKPSSSSSGNTSSNQVVETLGFSLRQLSTYQSCNSRFGALLYLTPNRFTFFGGYRFYFHDLQSIKPLQQAIASEIRDTFGHELPLNKDREHYLIRVTAQPLLEKGPETLVGFLHATLRLTKERVTIRTIKSVDLPFPFSYSLGKIMYAIMVNYMVVQFGYKIVQKFPNAASDAQQAKMMETLKRFGFEEAVDKQGVPALVYNNIFEGITELKPLLNSWAKGSYLRSMQAHQVMRIEPGILLSRKGISICFKLARGEALDESEQFLFRLQPPQDAAGQQMVEEIKEQIKELPKQEEVVEQSSLLRSLSRIIRAAPKTLLIGAALLASSGVVAPPKEDKPVASSGLVGPNRAPPPSSSIFSFLSNPGVNLFSSQMKRMFGGYTSPLVREYESKWEARASEDSFPKFLRTVRNELSALLSSIPVTDLVPHFQSFVQTLFSASMHHFRELEELKKVRKLVEIMEDAIHKEFPNHEAKFLRNGLLNKLSSMEEEEIKHHLRTSILKKRRLSKTSGSIE